MRAREAARRRWFAERAAKSWQARTKDNPPIHSESITVELLVDGDGYEKPGRLIITGSRQCPTCGRPE